MHPEGATAVVAMVVAAVEDTVGTEIGTGADRILVPEPL